MNGITVCVEYDDLLAITLPRNASHFDRVVVVSSPHDHKTEQVVSDVPNAELFTTDAFYRDGATFNKGWALEEGFEKLGRTGWIVVWDADTLFPLCMDVSGCEVGNLYTPKRRMLSDINAWTADMPWENCPVKKEREFCGYFQLFHGSDEGLSERPWYPTNWRHAGGCDSEFQARWPQGRKRRLPFHVLHLGQDGQNWCGRATRRLDGTMPPQARQRSEQLSRFKGGRDERGHGFRREKL